MDSSPAPDHSPSPWNQPEQDLANGNMQIDDASYIPAEMKRHFDFIDIRKDGRLLLGASSLTSRYWTGDVWLFNKAADAPDIGLFSAARELESGTSCGKFIDGLGVRAVVCQDLGVVEVLGWEEPDEDATDERLLITHGRSLEHDGAVLALDTLPAGDGGAGDADADAVRAVTGSADGAIKVWDLETLVADASYPGAHCHWVTGVTCHPSLPHQMVSCGLDGQVLMWDTRAARPASQLAGGGGDRPLCVAWSPTDSTTVAVGWESGRVSLLNAVGGGETAAAARGRPLHRLCWHPRRPWLAACGDEARVDVLAASDRIQTLHSDELHTDMVRGLAWQPDSDTLYSCGWDKRVLSRPVG
ncbi:methylosome protein 50-like [Pollicipes pollicipes]|uniref:methylosome protein 50-like n=1 Tax=Pollicipes pollicipes TaxID=41117 RepID=UPI001884B2E0|nr:methylosome protein 50-like [Pollicipes pollicipes]XP_037069833.1 methylosome protein 50-like [Pollicipes pollicipes]XP_037069834.1 methylosome protein 50-like [Pollicipes pollicipes]XP_037069835.1 methylosome protein 50-like [Pollicipes pollicipes]XP_037069836.1 methylosome protein 50-like [Pollicipes pollicipes]XP_037069837.1 methylosome protein 50-like [Pollicipes pollicipes]